MADHERLAAEHRLLQGDRDNLAGEHRLLQDDRDHLAATRDQLLRDFGQANERADQLVGKLIGAQDQIREFERRSEARLLKLESAIEARQRLERLYAETRDSVASLTAELDTSREKLAEESALLVEQGAALEDAKAALAASNAAQSSMTQMLNRQMNALRRLRQEAAASVAVPVPEPEHDA